MTKYTKLTTVALAAFLAGALALPVLARKPGADRGPEGEGWGRGRGEFPGMHHRGHGGPGASGPIERIAKFEFWNEEAIATKLNLTAEQKKQLAESHAATKKVLDADDDNAARTAREAIREEMEKDAPSLDTVMKLQAEAHEAAGARHKAMLSHAVAVKNILSEEQEEALRSAGREFAKERAKAVRQLHRELRDAETPEEAEAILEAADVPDEMKDRIRERGLDRFEDRGPGGDDHAPRARHRGPAGEGPDGDAPPPRRRERRNED